MTFQKQKTYSKSSHQRIAKPEKKTLRNWGLISAACILLLFAALAIVRPYERIERKVEHLLAQHAPGVTVREVTVRFPLTLTVTDLEIPVTINRQQRRLQMKQLQGNLSILPLLKGIMETEMNADFFGGILWVKIQTEAEGAGKQMTFDARARQMDLAQISRFATIPASVSGRCDIDAEGAFTDDMPDSLTATGLIMAGNIEMPAFDLESISLPPNHSGSGKAKISAAHGKLSLDEFALSGSAYDVSGTGTMNLRDPVEKSPIDCSVGIVFKEPFTITDPRLSGDGAENIVDALIESKSKVIVKVSGIIESPQTQLDAASSLLPLMKYLNRK